MLAKLNKREIGSGDTTDMPREEGPIEYAAES